MGEDEGGRRRLVWLMAAGLALAAVAILIVAGLLFTSARRARRAPRPPHVPAPAARAQRPAPPPRVPRRAPARPAVRAQEPGPAAFQGEPVAWFVGGGQHIVVKDRPEGSFQPLLVVMDQDYAVLGTLFLNKGDPLLPSQFILKDASWGEGQHFGGRNVLLGLVSCDGGLDEAALKAAAGRQPWWQGRTVQAFQMNF